jgi:hypothetical protein
MIKVNTGQALERLLPDARQPEDYEVRPDGSGGFYIHKWNLDTPQPTTQELGAAWVEVRRGEREAEIVAEISRKLQSLTGAGTNDLAMSLSIVDFYSAYKQSATKAELDQLEELGRLAKQKLYEVRTAPDPDEVELP